jgi:hypothetical protein
VQVVGDGRELPAERVADGVRADGQCRDPQAGPCGQFAELASGLGLRPVVLEPAPQRFLPAVGRDERVTRRRVDPVACVRAGAVEEV